MPGQLDLAQVVKGWGAVKKRIWNSTVPKHRLVIKKLKWK